MQYVVTRHAKNRFENRFGGFCLEDSIKKAVPYGITRGSSKYIIDLDHNIVFAIKENSIVTCFPKNYADNNMYITGTKFKEPRVVNTEVETEVGAVKVVEKPAPKLTRSQKDKIRKKINKVIEIYLKNKTDKVIDRWDQIEIEDLLYSHNLLNYESKFYEKLKNKYDMQKEENTSS